MKSGGQILWNAIAVCEMSKTSWQTGNLKMNQDVGTFKRPNIPFGALVEYFPNSERQNSKRKYYQVFL